MYTCSKCGATALVVKDQPIFRSCDCFVDAERKPETRFERFLAIFGKKFFYKKRASIITDISGSAKGSGVCKI